MMFIIRKCLEEIGNVRNMIICVENEEDYRNKILNFCVKGYIVYVYDLKGGIRGMWLEKNSKVS